VKRRTFIAGLGSAAVWRFSASAQKAEMPLIGFLNGGAEGPQRGYVAAFRRGLTERGYIEGRNVESVFKCLKPVGGAGATFLPRRPDSARAVSFFDPSRKSRLSPECPVVGVTLPSHGSPSRARIADEHHRAGLVV
jgi:hypothetical protein